VKAKATAGARGGKRKEEADANADSDEAEEDEEQEQEQELDDEDSEEDEWLSPDEEGRRSQCLLLATLTSATRSATSADHRKRRGVDAMLACELHWEEDVAES
jgi:hypothetical protein